MSYKIAVENIKCGGCASSIRSRLLHDAVVGTLARIGYPEVGSVEGVKATAAKARSVVSCAIGRVDNAVNRAQD